MKILLRNLWLIATILFLLIACSEKQEITQIEAEKLASDRFAEYIKDKKLSASKFSEPQVSFAKRDAAGKKFDAWTIYYVSSDTPKHHVNIIVGLYGDVELHQMTDE